VPEQAADAVRALEALHEIGGIERHARTVGEEPDRASFAARGSALRALRAAAAEDRLRLALLEQARSSHPSPFEPSPQPCEHAEGYGTASWMPPGSAITRSSR
jgi:hypothetical protein